MSVRTIIGSSSPRSMISMGSFRTIPNETPEEKYKRLELKYGKDLHDAIARKEKLRKERKVNNWMEVFVLLSDQKNPKPVSPISHINTPNGQLHPLVAAGLITTPEQSLMRRAAQPTTSKILDALKQNNVMTISKEDRERCDAWLDDAIKTEKSRLEALMKEDEQNELKIREQQEKVANLQRQMEELRSFEALSQGKTISVRLTPELNGIVVDNKLVEPSEPETMMPSSALLALLVFFGMFIIMYLSKW